MPARTHTTKKRAFHSSASKPPQPPPPPPAEEPAVSPSSPPPPQPDQISPPSVPASVAEPPPVSPPAPAPPPPPPPPAPPSSPADTSPQVHQLASLFTAPPSPPPAEPSTTTFFRRLPTPSAPHHKLVWLALILALATGAGVAGLAIYNFTAVQPGPVGNQAPAPSPAATPAFSPTPAFSLNRQDLRLQVLNGSGTPGAAGDAEEFLEGLGYKDVASGNADSYDYAQTEISIKPDKKAYFDLLLSDLSAKYSVSTSAGVLTSTAFDAVITVGRK